MNRRTFLKFLGIATLMPSVPSEMSALSPWKITSRPGMASTNLAVVKTWMPGKVLLAEDLNAVFENVFFGPDGSIHKVIA